MPLYEYFCPKCDKTFELLIRSEETPCCPACENKKVVRQMSAPAGHVKSSSSDCSFPKQSGCGHGPACAGCPMS